jgi:hypothetical protein
MNRFNRRQEKRTQFYGTENQQTRFVNSFKQTREWRRLQGPKTCLDGADFLHGVVLTDRQIRFYRFEGVLLKQGMMISDQPDRWHLIDEIKELLNKLTHLKGKGQKGKPTQRLIEQLATQVTVQI